jgi:hypothetical protein
MLHLMSLLFPQGPMPAQFTGKSEAGNGEKLITTISAKKTNQIDGLSRIQVHFYGRSMNQESISATDIEDEHHMQHEMEIPSWWTARDFLAVLYILTVGDIFWLTQVGAFPRGIFPFTLIGITRVQDAFDWSRSEMQHIIRKYGAYVVVRGGNSD